jgi:Domain of unknown function (DUF1824)
MRITSQKGLMRAAIVCLAVLTTKLFLCLAFSLSTTIRWANTDGLTTMKSQQVSITPEVVTNVSRILSDWDRAYSSNTVVTEFKSAEFTSTTQSLIVDAVLVLNKKAAEERSMDATQGRCMLGICASSSDEGIATLKSWVTNLELPRGLLLGMDVDGVPTEFKGGVYIKYNSGGVYTFADIRKSQMGFNAIWKPGDAMIEEYGGTYRGVYFQVELIDREFRQYLLPHNLFDQR